MLCTEVCRLHMPCEAMLEQALSGSKDGDVAFRFEDGRSQFAGHRSQFGALRRERGICDVSERDVGGSERDHQCPAWND